MTQGSDFWSRRKAKVEAEAQEDVRQTEEAEVKATQAALEEKSDEEILEELGLPDPDTLEPGQDVTGFMQKAVPERLRQRALRKLWRLNPVLANLDGLCDYNDDFTNAATDAPGVATAYRVGKGLLRHIEALEEQAKAERLAAENSPENLSEIAEICKDSENTADSENNAVQNADNADAATASTTIVEDTSEYADSVPLDTNERDPVRPRRMRFRIESDANDSQRGFDPASRI